MFSEGEKMEEQKNENDVALFLREHPEMKMQELADMMGVSKGWISMLANGRRNIPKWMPVVLKGLRKPRKKKEATS
jgi:transcriptional regulator with XRE-family HTH domain